MVGNRKRKGSRGPYRNYTEAERDEAIELGLRVGPSKAGRQLSIA